MCFSLHLNVLFCSVSRPSHLLLQVQVEDPDEDKNGLITMALQMGMPRLDFYLNTTTGVLTSTAVLDREQIGQYYLRIIAYDAGRFPRTSTSTLTVSGESLWLRMTRNGLSFPFALSETALHKHCWAAWFWSYYILIDTLFNKFFRGCLERYYHLLVGHENLKLLLTC